jgi:LCP family protein required for cell wall assembly
VREGNVRSQPSTTGAIVAELGPGAAVSATARSGDWARITVTRTGVNGWAIRSLLSLTASQFASLPVSGGTPQASAPAAGSVPQVSAPVGAANGTTILLMGVDRRPRERASRADALMLLRIDPGSGTIAALSLPRDLYVPIPGRGSQKINNAYLYGGMALQKQTVANFLGVRIDYAVAANFSGFAALVDAIGGITVNVPRRLIDNAYPTENYGTVRVRFEPGVQRMNGARALIYARTRHPDSDFGRIGRQQQVVAAMGNQIRALGVAGSLARANQIASILSNYVATDMPVSAIASVLWNARNAGNVRTYVVNLSYCRPGTIGGAYVLIPNRPAIQALAARWARG